MKKLHTMADVLAVAVKPIGDLIGWLLIAFVGAYKAAVSPWLGSHCRFYPTCSSYAQQAIREYGPLGGCARAFARIARCHPFHEGGYDPLR